MPSIQDMLGDVKHTGEETLSIIKKKQMDEETVEVVKWLTSDTVDYNDVQLKTLDKCVKNTGQWILKLPEFLAWVDGSGKSHTLRCQGAPGVGKTFLASIIVDYLHSLLMVKERKALVLSIFCDYKSMVKNPIESVLRSLLKQLVQDYGLFPLTKTLYVNKKIKHPSYDDLTECLSEVIQCVSSQVYLVLDALDEVANDHRAHLINVIRGSLGNSIHLLVMSRPDIALDSLFEADTTFNIEASTEDIKLYITDRVSKSPRLTSHIMGKDGIILQEEILSKVTEKSYCMFLLARLHMDCLAETRNKKKLKDALAKLPENIMGAYAEILESRINSQNNEDKDLALQIFGWIALAKRPLTVLELQHALAVDLNSVAFEPDSLYSEDLLGSVCGGLVIISGANQELWHRNPIMKFAHYTAQEYFMSQKDNLFPQLQETIACTCLTYMSFNNFRPYYDIDQCDDIWLDCDLGNDNNTSNDSNNVQSSVSYKDKNYPFLGYSLNYWAYHSSEVQHLIVNKIIAFLDSACIGKIFKTYHAVRSTLAVTPLEVAVQYELSYVAKKLLRRGNDPCQCKRPLLLTASQIGNAEMVKLLLDYSKIDMDCKDGQGRTPLSYAAEGWSREIVEMLWHSDQVDVDCMDSQGCTPLSYAAGVGFREIVEMLLQSDQVDVDSKDSQGRTPLSYAVGRGSREIVKMLLQSDQVDVNCKDS
ncbi:hypothetical protein IW261DRAFT_1020132, partial [Armillaria novae-zelandiae]